MYSLFESFFCHDLPKLEVDYAFCFLVFVMIPCLDYTVLSVRVDDEYHISSYLSRSQKKILFFWVLFLFGCCPVGRAIVQR